MNIKYFKSHLLSLLSILISTSVVACNSFSGTKAIGKSVSIGYGTSTKTYSQKTAGAGAATFLIGYIFKELDKAITEARTGNFGDKGIRLSGTGSFPKNGHLIIVRTVSDPANNFPNIAGVKDFLQKTPGTPGDELRKEIIRSSSIDSQDLERSLAQAIQNADKPSIEDTDKISLLVYCPIIQLETGITNAANIYGVTLSGMYYPLLAGSRFAGESSDIFSRISKSKESMVVEIYGPQGSGFTTGVVQVPLAWSPPSSKDERAQWVTSEKLFDTYKARHNTDLKKLLDDVLQKDGNIRLDHRQAFIQPRRNIRPLLRADFSVSETSEATGWIIKLMEKAEEQLKGGFGE
jgi:hypothetical protein